MKQQIEHVAVAVLIPYARNSRTHSKAQVSQIAGSIREFGFTNPVLIDAENGIIAGHGRVLAAQKLGMDDVPCIRLAHLNELQKQAYVIADNKLSLNSEWDDAMLACELADLVAAGYNTELIGFTQDEIAASSKNEKNTEINNQSIKEQYLVMIECNSDIQQRFVLQKLIDEGYECRALTS